MTVYGSQTVTLVRRVPVGTPPDLSELDDLGTYPMEEILVNMPGCLHRPITARAEIGAGLARAEEQPSVGVSAAVSWWRTTVPVGSYGAALRNAVLGAQPSDQLRYNGETFQIIGGTEGHPDFANPTVKMTFTSERQTVGASA